MYSARCDRAHRLILSSLRRKAGSAGRDTSRSRSQKYPVSGTSPTIPSIGFASPPVKLENQHGIAIAEEPISTVNCLGICGTGQVKTREGTHQNKQATAGQVKVCDQSINSAEDVSRLNEKLSIA